MHQVATVRPTKSVDALTYYLNIFLFFSVYFSVSQDFMCNYEVIDVSVMSLWHVPTFPIYHIASEY